MVFGSIVTLVAVGNVALRSATPQPLANWKAPPAEGKSKTFMKPLVISVLLIVLKTCADAPVRPVAATAMMSRSFFMGIVLVGLVGLVDVYFEI